jgi:hypothetical protein
MSYNVKNYTEQGGEVTHIGGTLVVEEGGSIEGLPSSFTPAENQAASTATTVAALKDDFNALLSKLKTAGLMEADTEPDPQPDPDPDPHNNDPS